MSYCFGCFAELNEGQLICPHCGFSLDRYVMQKWILRPGKVLNNKYIVGKRLGEGGFGITYLAYDIYLHSKIAIKEYYPSYMVSRDVTSTSGDTVLTTGSEFNSDFEDGLRKYANEASVLSQFFNLPGIVSVKDFFYENQTAYIVMEYIDGVSLKDYLKNRGGKIPADEAIKLIRPVISSMAVVHDHKLLHRDISPDNIMLQRDGTVKLIDFGTARYFDIDATQKSMTVMLKHGYAPIEQYSRNGRQGAFTDVYAICAVLYRMITGDAPVESPDRTSHDYLIPIRTVAKKTPKYIAETIQKGLAVKPEDRYQNLYELEKDLFSTKGDRAAKTADKLYKFTVRFLVTLLILIILSIGIGVAYKLNQEKVDAYFAGIRSAVLGHAEEESNSPEELENVEVLTESVPAPKIEDSTTETSQEKEPLQEETATLQEEEPVSSSPANEVHTVDELSDEDANRINYGIMVVRDGVISGKESYTTGQILDYYADYAGEWSGYIDPDTDELFIYYQGYRNAESFAVEFTVYSNDTFKVSAAGKNGVRIDNYSEFFQEILSNAGL